MLLEKWGKDSCAWPSGFIHQRSLYSSPWGGGSGVACETRAEEHKGEGAEGAGLLRRRIYDAHKHAAAGVSEMFYIWTENSGNCSRALIFSRLAVLIPRTFRRWIQIAESRYPQPATRMDVEFTFWISFEGLTGWAPDTRISPVGRGPSH